MIRHLAGLVALLLTTALVAQAPAPIDPTGVTGTRLLAGGGKLPPEIFARFLELAGGDRAKVVLIPTASQTADDPKENEDTLRLYRERLPGAEVTLLHTRDRAVADDETFCVPLARATGVWMTGGAQDRLASAYLGTRVERELMAVLARGGVIGGTSAGTAIQTRTMIESGLEKPIVATGFDFVPGAVSDQHFLKRKRLPRLLKVLAQHPGLFGIGVDEGTAAVVHGDSLEVIGASKVLLVLPEFNGHEQMVSEFDRGSRTIDLGWWRRTAELRASWALPKEFAAPRLPGGSLVLGRSRAALARFVQLAGGNNAKVVLVPWNTDRGNSPEFLLMGSLHQAGVTDVRGLSLPLKGCVAEDQLGPLSDATGVVVYQSEIWVNRAFDCEPARQALAGVLARGGVVWGCQSLGDVAPADGSGKIDFELRRGLGLLPGCLLADEGERDPASASVGVDFKMEAWRAQLPQVIGIGIRGAAIVSGSELEVLEGSQATVLPARGETPNAKPPIHLEPGARYDLVTGARR